MLARLNPFFAIPTVPKPIVHAFDEAGSWDRLFNAGSNLELKENDDKSFSYLLDVPGVKIEDIDISIEARVIAITAVRKDRSSNSSVEAKFKVTEEYNLNTISAELNDGVLSLHVQRESKESSKIKVEIAKKITHPK